MNVESFEFEPELRARFVEAGYRVHAMDEKWIAPFRSEMERQLSADNPFFSYGRARGFLASRGGKPLARVAAFVNPHLNHEGDAVGLLGMYEAEPDAEAAAAVLEEAMAWLEQDGHRHVLGPMAFSVWYPHRFMVKGFERDPFVGEPYNPPYYAEQWVAAGFEETARYGSFDFDQAQLRALLSGARKRGGRSLYAGGLKSTPLRMDRFEEELAHLHALLSEAWSELPGFAPIPLAEMQALQAGLKHLAVPELLPLVRNAEDKVVAMGYLYPDAADAIRNMDGDLGLLSKLKLAFAKGSSDRLVIQTLAVQRAYRGQGLVDVLLTELLELALARGISRTVGALAAEDSTLYKDVYRAVGEPTREYVLMRRRL